MTWRLLHALPVVAFAACGPSVPGDNGDNNGGPDATPTNCVAEVCDNGGDDDCDALDDCEDPDCAGNAACATGNPNCGTLENVEGQPLALPDGTSGLPTATCGPVTATGQYVSTINFAGFTAGQTLAAGSDILGICVKMEHSWLHDLQIEMSCPTGQLVVLDQFRGVGSGGPLFMGQPDDSDDVDPNPGVGFEYCWSPTATMQMLDWGNSGTLPPGQYASSCPIDGFVGCELNGPWTIKVTDLWGIDNGFIFSWGIRFDPNIVENCEDWPVD